MAQTRPLLGGTPRRCRCASRVKMSGIDEYGGLRESTPSSRDDRNHVKSSLNRRLAFYGTESCPSGKELVLKTSDPGRGRGFESYTLRQYWLGSSSQTAL